MLIRILSFILIIFPVAACAQQSLTYDEFLEKHMAAMGGKEKLENIMTVKSKLIIHEDINPITNDSTALDGGYMANRDGQMRVDIYIEGNRVFTEALSSMDDGWQQDGEGEPVKPLSEIGKKTLQKSIHSNLYALHELEGLGYKVEFQDVQELMGDNYYAVDITNMSGDVERQFFDMDTFLRAATMDESALHVDVDPTKVLSVSTNKNYKMVNGIMHSFSGEVIDLRANKVIQRFELIEIEFNTPQDKTYFFKP